MQLSQYHPVFTKVVNRTLSSFLYRALGLFLLLLSHHSLCCRRLFGEMFKCISTHTVSVAFQWTFRFIVVEYTQLGLGFQCTTTTQRRHCVCSVSSCIYANRVYIYQESCVLVFFFHFAILYIAQNIDTHCCSVRLLQQQLLLLLLLFVVGPSHSSGLFVGCSVKIVQHINSIQLKMFIVDRFVQSVGRRWVFRLQNIVRLLLFFPINSDKSFDITKKQQRTVR